MLIAITTDTTAILHGIARFHRGGCATPREQFSGHLAISADGRHVLYRPNTEEEAQLYLRSLDDLVEKPIPGTEGAVSPFFSPDGESVAFLCRRPTQEGFACRRTTHNPL